MAFLYQVFECEGWEGLVPLPIGVSYDGRDEAIEFAKAQFPRIKNSSSYEFKAIEMIVVEYRTGVMPVVAWKKKV